MARDDDSFASLFENSQGARIGARRYHPGESLEVVIVAVARDAVFADLGGKQEGFFERNDLCDDQGNLRVAVGARVTAVVRKVDAATGQVQLAPVVVRQTAEDPGVAVAASSTGSALAVGARVKGKITGIERYGFFVQLVGTQGRSGRGLVPTQETGTPRGADLKKHFAVGQEIETKILAIDDDGKIRLSIGALRDDDDHLAYEAFKAGQGGSSSTVPAGEPGAKRPAPKKEKPGPKNFGTLGDLLAKRKGK